MSGWRPPAPLWDEGLALVAAGLSPDWLTDLAALALATPKVVSKQNQILHVDGAVTVDVSSLH